MRREAVVDKGCSMHPSCEECPLAECKYDTADARHGRFASKTLILAEQVALLKQQGLNNTEIGRRLGVSRGWVQNLVKIAERQG